MAGLRDKVKQAGEAQASGTAPGGEPYDKRQQYDAIVAGLLDGEEVLAVFDCIGVGTGFVGVTSHRVVLQDNSFVGKKTALTSIPYGRISAVSFLSNKNLVGFTSTSEIALIVGSKTYEAAFRGEEKAQLVHDEVLARII